MGLESYLTEFTPLLKVDPKAVQTLVDALVDAYKTGTWVFIIGNGGSGANASHLAEDLGKGTLTDFENQKRLKVLSLTDNTPWILALGNDLGYDKVFVEQLKHYAAPGHILISISGSGNSPNIIRALEYAKGSGIATIAVTGFDGGQALAMADISLHVPLHDMCSAESIHSIVFHYIILALKERISQYEKATLPHS